jgi:hypothetical protein
MASRRLTPPAVRAQFLCYKQLKKFLKQLPDTSVGARSLRTPQPVASDSGNMPLAWGDAFWRIYRQRAASAPSYA